MVEVRPGEFVNERVASLLKDDPIDAKPSHRGRRRPMREPEDAR